MIFNKGDRIIFTGDSVTDSGRARPIGEGLHTGVGTGYVRDIENILNVLYPELDLYISNLGVSGYTSRSLKSIWDNEVMTRKADWISIMIGVNDIWRQFDQPGIISSHVYPEEYESNLTEIIKKTLPNVKGIIVMSPFFMENQPGDAMLIKVREYAEISRRIANEYGCLYIDLQKAFDEYLKYRHSSYISWDRVHPGEIGSLIIAGEFCRAVGLERKLF